MFPWFSSVLELILRRSQNPCFTSCFTRSSPQSKLSNFRQGIALHGDLDVIKMLLSKDKIQPKFSDSLFGYILQNIPLSIVLPSSLSKVFNYYQPTFTRRRSGHPPGTFRAVNSSEYPPSFLYNNKHSACHFTSPPPTMRPSLSVCIYNLYVKSRSLFRDLYKTRVPNAQCGYSTEYLDVKHDGTYSYRRVLKG